MEAEQRLRPGQFTVCSIYQRLEICLKSLKSIVYRMMQLPQQCAAFQIIFVFLLLKYIAAVFSALLRLTECEFGKLHGVFKRIVHIAVLHDTARYRIHCFVLILLDECIDGFFDLMEELFRRLHTATGKIHNCELIRHNMEQALLRSYILLDTLCGSS